MLVEGGSGVVKQGTYFNKVVISSQLGVGELIGAFVDKIITLCLTNRGHFLHRAGVLLSRRTHDQRWVGPNNIR